jgi:hypothetical protein
MPRVFPPGHPATIHIGPPQEQLLQREHKKEGKRARKRERELMVQAGLRPAPGQEGAAAAAEAEEEDEGIVAGRIISYCALDYPRILDSVRWRLAMMKKNWEVGDALACCSGRESKQGCSIC